MTTTRFSLPWQQTRDGGWKAGDYEIGAAGIMFELRYRHTLIHTGFTVYDCKIAADKHRGLREAG
jgi:hypothetical protein